MEVQEAQGSASPVHPAPCPQQDQEVTSALEVDLGLQVVLVQGLGLVEDLVLEQEEDSGESVPLEQQMTASLAMRSSPCRISTTVWLHTWRRCAPLRKPMLS
uniref:(northern house mosquito) hypothetical protein n=1 Tax=Culex pipiens TaxID=7175 RepID=A0A8D8BHK8_CULPI